MLFTDSQLVTPGQRMCFITNIDIYIYIGYGTLPAWRRTWIAY